MNNSAVVKVTYYNGKLQNFDLDGAPKELQDRIKAMLQHTNIEHYWKSGNTAICIVSMHVNNLLNWILASGWTLTHCFSSSERVNASTDTYVFQK